MLTSLVFEGLTIDQGTFGDDDEFYNEASTIHKGILESVRLTVVVQF